MADQSPSLSVHVKLTVDPLKTEAFLEALRPTFEKVTAEPLNTFFEVYQDGQTPGVYKLVENWNATLDYMMNVSEGVFFYVKPRGGRESKYWAD
jgi:hypothetical protein